MQDKNKMNNSNAKFEEWCEVKNKYFSKELEKNLAQHKADERMYKCKLEVYYKTFLDFVYGSLISIEALSQDEENEARPSGTTQETRCRLRNHKYSKGEVKKIKNHK